MAEASISTSQPSGKDPDLTDLESPIMDLVHLTRIADGVVETTLNLDRGVAYGDDFRCFTLSNSEVSDISFLLGMVQHRTRLLSEAFYALRSPGSEAD